MLLKLFIEFFKIGAFSFGGGFATLPHLFELSDKTGWFNYSEVNNMITISQMTPGPLACNMATYIGFKMQGICGAILTSKRKKIHPYRSISIYKCYDYKFYD